jgi:hypothetical protein
MPAAGLPFTVLSHADVTVRHAGASNNTTAPSGYRFMNVWLAELSSLRCIACSRQKAGSSSTPLYSLPLKKKYVSVGLDAYTNAAKKITKMLLRSMHSTSTRGTSHAAVLHRSFWSIQRGQKMSRGEGAWTFACEIFLLFNEYGSHFF